ncbi:MAG: O-methyltransferase [Bacteroides sp.]|nr:O-methyltransferase [Bacteroides sp.]
MEYTDLLFDYIEAHIDREPEYLHRLERESNLRMVHGRMCSGHLQGRLLRMLAGMARPRRVLELGTFTGYSTLCLAEALADVPGARVDTIEIFDENEDFLRRVFAGTPLGERVNLIIGDALEVMPRLEAGSYDLIFIDADKRLYPEYLELSLRLLRPGGYIMADNTLWDGHVAEPGRNDPQTRGVKRFNDLVAADRRLEKVIIPLRDGLTLIRLRPEAGVGDGGAGKSN